MRKTFFISILTFVVFSFGKINAFQGDTVLVCLKKEGRPNAFINARDKSDGILIDIWREIASKNNFHAKFKFYQDNDFGFMLSKDSNTVFGNVFWNNESEEFLSLSRPLEVRNAHLYFDKNITGVHDIEDLSGFKVGVVQNSGLADFLRIKNPNIRLMTYRDPGMLVKDIMDNKITIFAGDRKSVV